PDNTFPMPETTPRTILNAAENAPPMICGTARKAERIKPGTAAKNRTIPATIAGIFWMIEKSVAIIPRAVVAKRPTSPLTARDKRENTCTPASTTKKLLANAPTHPAMRENTDIIHAVTVRRCALAWRTPNASDRK
ncbi:MAG: hypothetical protein LBU65_03505, partial [Planctomycetaceae bacterium]|nr:hypothetical protein [Planctomycetaceae bacterium]